MRYLSVCSGIEAATVAWHPLGWKAAAYSEIEKFPSQVLAHHYPDVPNVGDMTKFKEWTNVSNVDVLVGGTPCQSFSVAGLRKGLDDPRGNLMLTYLAIAAKFRPKWLVWENVPGVLSSNGGLDFASLLRGMGECGYGFAYRVLDAQYFGVAQRRKRVFVVGCLGDWRAAAAVLFERHSLSGYPAPSREKRKSVTPITGPSSPDGGETIGTLMARDYKGFGNQDMKDGRGLVLDPILIGGQDCKHFSSEISGMLVTREGSVSDSSHMLMQPIPFGVSEKPDVGHCLRSSASKADKHESTTYIAQPIPFDTTQITSKANYSKPESGDPCHPLAARAHPPAIVQPIAFSRNDDGRDATHDLAPTMRVAGNAGGMLAAAVGTDLYNGAITGDVAVPMTNRSDGTGTGPTVMQVVGFEENFNAIKETQIAPAMTTKGYGVTQNAGGLGIRQALAVRRLTPVECERLQGFPDNYTDIQPKGKATPDGPRYKALGNSMAVPVMAWIGKRIQEVENL
jgi:DNA (cytosine-5)-methyltransferase 1